MVGGIPVSPCWFTYSITLTISPTSFWCNAFTLPGSSVPQILGLMANTYRALTMCSSPACTLYYYMIAIPVLQVQKLSLRNLREGVQDLRAGMRRGHDLSSHSPSESPSLNSYFVLRPHAAFLWLIVLGHGEAVIRKDVCTPVFIAALLIIVDMEGTQGSIRDEWIKKIRYTHTPHSGILL